jgi:hypothetical protein
MHRRELFALSAATAATAMAASRFDPARIRTSQNVSAELPTHSAPLTATFLSCEQLVIKMGPPWSAIEVK